MPQLISVKSASARHATNKNIRVQWNMGNSCNYDCVYCPPILHDGSRPWLPLDIYIATIEKICNHYNNIGRRVDFELIGGEVTVIPGFEQIMKTISAYNTTSTVFTNASRTIKWWSNAKHYIDSAVLTFHPLSQEKDHFINVINEIKNDVHISINIAGVGGKVEELSRWAEYIRGLFVDGNINTYHNISICVKTMYKKLLGANSKQETFWNYEDSEIDVLKKPSIKTQENIKEYTQQNPDPKDWMTELLYDDGTVQYFQNHQILHENLNKFKGMKCELGYDSINISPTGDITGSWCGAVNFGNISSINDWQLPTCETVCPYEFCNNVNDLNITKVR